jgi:Mitochondrial glycoprotein
VCPLQKYEELDDRVQTACDAYLEERGIDADFGEYLMKLAADKEQRECVHCCKTPGSAICSLWRHLVLCLPEHHQG